MATCIILNKNAGSLDDPDALKSLLESASLGDKTIHCPESAGHALELAKSAIDGGCTRIIIAGGDGSLNDMVQVIHGAGADVELGLIPLGTGNDFARTMGIPNTPKEAIAVLEKGHTRQVDVIKITAGDEHHIAINVSGGGFTGKVADAVSERSKSFLGVMAYAKAVVEKLPELEAHCATITLDGGDPIDEELLNVFVCNGQFVGGGTHVCPEATPDDGYLNIVLVKDGTKAQILSLIPKAVQGDHLGHELVIHTKAKTISISSDPPMIVNADGELLERANRTWEVLPGAISFVCPDRS